MKKLNKLVSGFCLAMLGMLMLTGCEGSEIYKVGAPNWLDDKLDSITNSKTPEVGLYSIGTTSLNAPFWTLGKSHVVPAGGTLEMIINLTVNPDNKYYKNFYTVITNDVSINPRGGGYYEYGVMRYDNDRTKNSEWGDIFTDTDRDNYISGNFTNTSGADDIDDTVQGMNGLVKVTVDRSNGGLTIKYEGENFTKTYSRPDLVNHNPEPTNENIRVTLGVEGSFVNVIESNIDPVDDTKDYEPISMTLKAPKKVLVATPLSDIISAISAEVDFGEGGIKTVTGEKLTINVVPDLNSIGTKTIVAAYNKTSKGEAAKKAVVSSIQLEVVDKMYTLLGAADNSTPFFGARSGLVKIAPNETFITTFTNYTAGGSNWENYLVVLSKGDLTLGADGEYAVLRADNFGWGNGYGTCTATCSHSDWAAWLAAMNGGKVTVQVTNNGDGTADVEAVTVGSDANIYTQTYKGITVSDPNDFYFSLTLEKAHLEFDGVLGNEDNTTPFFGAKSDPIKVPAGHTVTTRFRNYTNGGANWNNYLAVVCKADLTLGADGEYAVLRADNFGWGNGYGTCTAACDHTDWAAWLEAMNEGLVTLSVTNKGDGTADVKAVTLGSDGNTYTQTYTGITVDASDVNFYLTMEGAHIVFE